MSCLEINYPFPFCGGRRVSGPHKRLTFSFPIPSPNIATFWSILVCMIIAFMSEKANNMKDMLLRSSTPVNINITQLWQKELWLGPPDVYSAHDDKSSFCAQYFN